MTFLSSLGYALGTLPAAERGRLPRLNALEDVLADCAVAGYLDRPALQVMAAMDTRTQTWSEDHFYAMMGAISTEPARGVEVRSPAEAFMALCERRGDYSFVFSSDARDEKSGRRWRPRDDGALPAVLRLTVTGPGVDGRVSNVALRGWVEGGVLKLEGVVVLKPGKVGDDGRGFIARWLEGSKPGGAYEGLELEEAAFEALRELGFSGSGAWLETEPGLFFPQWWRFPENVQIEVVVAVGIQWRLGSPGLARYRASPREDVMYVPGVFFGKVGVGNEHVTATLD